jgi:hypothetical protein
MIISNHWYDRPMRLLLPILSMEHLGERLGTEICGGRADQGWISNFGCCGCINGLASSVDGDELSGSGARRQPRTAGGLWHTPVFRS